MHFKQFVFLFIGLIMIQGMTCRPDPDPTLIELDIKVVDESNVPLPGALLALSSSYCVLDTFSTGANGEVEYTFFGEDYYYTGSYYLRLLANGGVVTNSTDIFNGTNQFTLKTKKTQPLLSISIKPSVADSIFIGVYADVRLSGEDLCNYFSELKLHLGDEKIFNTAVGHQFLFDVAPNDTVYVRYIKYPTLDSILTIGVGEEVVELEL